jgi:hypothetical protein
MQRLFGGVSLPVRTPYKQGMDPSGGTWGIVIQYFHVANRGIDIVTVDVGCCASSTPSSLLEADKGTISWYHGNGPVIGMLLRSERRWLGINHSGVGMADVYA